jgi:hypothetical protein
MQRFYPQHNKDREKRIELTRKGKYYVRLYCELNDQREKYLTLTKAKMTSNLEWREYQLFPTK